VSSALAGGGGVRLYEIANLAGLDSAAGRGGLCQVLFNLQEGKAKPFDTGTVRAEIDWFRGDFAPLQVEPDHPGLSLLAFADEDLRWLIAGAPWLWTDDRFKAFCAAFLGACRRVGREPELVRRRPDALVSAGD
jgi:hypothetical protein